MAIRITIPPRAAEILDTLHGAGFEAYVVGGCVRDSVIGREPGDWDITTNALPQDVKALFRRTIDTGIEHGTVTVMLGSEGYEVTTYRLDGEYEDGRHPKAVTFTPSLVEDLKRRDFTINAMAYDEEHGLVDEFDGQQDLEQKVIRCVGDPMERLSEDALRMMRAVRFGAQLDFAIEQQTWEAIRNLAGTLEKISAERIRVELEKLLVSAHPEQFRIFYDLGLTGVFMPEFNRCMECPQTNPHHCYSVGEHILKAVEVIRECSDDKDLRLAVLLHDIAKPVVKTTDAEGIDHFHGHAELGEKMAEEILRRLKYDNDTIRHVKALVRWHDIRFLKPDRTPERVRKWIWRVGGPDIFRELLDVRYADTLAQSEYKREAKLQEITDLRAMLEEILAAGDPLSIADLCVGGQDLKEAGITPGPDMGKMLKCMLREVLRVPAHNTKEYLLSDSQLHSFMQQARDMKS